MSEYAIEMLGITKRFPGIIANDNITLQLKKSAWRKWSKNGEVNFDEDECSVFPESSQMTISHFN